MKEINIGNLEFYNEIEIGDLQLDVKNVYPELEKVTVQSRKDEQLIKPTKYGFSEIAVKPIEINLEDKTVIPTKDSQEVTASDGNDGLNKVTIEKIPDEYIIPAGSVDITTNGTYDVTDKATANVNVPEKQLGTKTITSNGLYKATDDNLDGYSEVNVETSGVDINNYWDMEKNIRNFKPIYFIKNIPLLKTSNTVSMSSAFSQFSTLQTIPELDTSNVTDMNNMFYNCSSLQTIPLLNTTKVTNMSDMFYECSILSEIPELDTPNVTNMDYMFYGCKVLKKIPKLKANSVKELMNCFVSCNELENFGGLENIGEAYLTTKAELYSYYTIALNYSTKLTHESLMNVINNLYDIKTAGVKTQRLILISTTLSKLTADEIAVATNKGWTVN